VLEDVSEDPQLKLETAAPSSIRAYPFPSPGTNVSIFQFLFSNFYFLREERAPRNNYGDRHTALGGFG
jgi:hypothetical protein